MGMISFVNDFAMNYYHNFVLLFFLCIILLYFASGLIRQDFKYLKKDKRFIYIVVAMSVLFVAFLPHQVLTYYDEHNYLVIAKNINELGKSTVCLEMVGGECQNLHIPETSLTPGAVYSYLFDEDYSKFQFRIHILNQLLYFINAILAYLIGAKISKNRMIARMLISFQLFMPFILMYSGSLSAETMVITFLLLTINFMFAFYSGVKTKLDDFYLISAILLSFTILMSLRIEFNLLAILFVYILSVRLELFENKKLKFANIFSYLKKGFRVFQKKESKVRIISILIGIFAWAMIFVSSLNVLYYILNKVVGDNKANQITMGWEYFNLRFYEYFISHFFVSIIFIGFFMLLLSVLIYQFSKVFYRIKILSSFRNFSRNFLQKTDIDHRYFSVAFILAIVFLIYVVLFSFLKSCAMPSPFSFFRHTLPERFLLLLVAALGLYMFFELVSKYVKVKNLFIIIFVVMLLSHSSAYLSYFLNEYEEGNDCSNDYLEAIGEFKDSPELKNAVIFNPSYPLITDYYDYYDYFKHLDLMPEKMEEYEKVYYVQIEGGHNPQIDSSEYEIDFAEGNDRCMYYIYQIKRI